MSLRDTLNATFGDRGAFHILVDSHWPAIDKALSNAELSPISASAAVDEIAAHLGAAAAQIVPSDDQIIAGHVRAALCLAQQLQKAQRS